MRSRTPALLSSLALASVVGLASSATADDKAPEKVTFNDHVAPVFRSRCGSCHNPDKAKGGLNLETYSGAMQGGGSGKVIEPGDPDSSSILGLILQTDEPKMPPKSDKIPDAEIAIVRKWIEGGALESAGSVAAVKAKPKFEMKLDPSAVGKPAGEPAMPQDLITEPFIPDAHPSAVVAMAASPWAPLVAIGGHKQVLLYRTTDHHLMGVLPFPEGTIHVLRFSRNGDILLAGGGRGGQSGLAVGFNVKTGGRVFEVGKEYDAVISADISPDHGLVALGGPSRLLRVYNTADNSLVYEMKKHTEWVTAVEFSPDGVLLASGDRNNGLMVWESGTGREYLELRGHNTAITDLDWRADSNLLASSSEDGTIKLWEMENGTTIKNIAAHPPGASSVRFAKDGRLVTAGRDRVVRIWDQNGAKQREFEPFGDLALRAVFTHDESAVAGAGWSGEIRLWNAADGQRLTNFAPNPAPIATRIEQARQEMAAAAAQAESLGKELPPLQAAAASATDAQTRAQQAAAAAEQAAAQQAGVVAEGEKVVNAKVAALQDAAATAGAAEQIAAQAQAAQAAAEKAVADSVAAEKAAADALAASRTAVEKALADKTAADPAVAAAAAALKAAGDADATAKAVEELAKQAQHATELLQAVAAAGRRQAEALTALNVATAAKAAAPAAVGPAQLRNKAAQIGLAASKASAQQIEQEKAAAEKALTDARAAAQTATAAVADLKKQLEVATAAKAAADKTLADKAAPAVAAQTKAAALKTELELLAVEKQRADSSKGGLAATANKDAQAKRE